jgi:Domain of unknown function (DUF222)
METSVSSIVEAAALPTERLEAELVAHAAWEAVSMARMLAVLAEFDRREGYRSWGCASSAHWLGWKCGLGRVAASERVRVAHALTMLPVTMAALAGGELSFSKVREITRVATADSEQVLVDIARHATAGQVSRLVTAMRQVTAGDAEHQMDHRSCEFSSANDGSVIMILRMPGESGTVVRNQVCDGTTAVKGEPIARTRADTAMALLLGGQAIAASVVVHVHPDHVETDHGHPIAPEVADLLACDGDVTVVEHMVDGPVETHRRRSPTRVQRR